MSWKKLLHAAVTLTLAATAVTLSVFYANGNLDLSKQKDELDELKQELELAKQQASAANAAILPAPEIAVVPCGNPNATDDELRQEVNTLTQNYQTQLQETNKYKQLYQAEQKKTLDLKTKLTMQEQQWITRQQHQISMMADMAELYEKQKATLQLIEAAYESEKLDLQGNINRLLAQIPKLA